MKLNKKFIEWLLEDKEGVNFCETWTKLIIIALLGFISIELIKEKQNH